MTGRVIVHRRMLIAIGAAVLIAGCIFGLWDVRRRWVGSDFRPLVSGGRALLDGRNPYEGVSPGVWRYVYLPLFGLLVSPLHAADGKGQVTVWFVISVGLAALCVHECRRLLRTLARVEGPAGAAVQTPHWIMVAAALSMLLPVLDALQRGTIGLAITYLLLVGFRLAWQGSSGVGIFLGGIVMALPITFKLTPALPVGFIVLLWLCARNHGNEARPHVGRRGLAAGSGVIIGLLLFALIIPGAVLGWKRNIEYLDSWAKKIQASAKGGPQGDNLHMPRNQSMSNALELFARWVPRTSSAGRTLARDPAYPDLLAQPRVPRAILDSIVWSVRLIALVLLFLVGRRLVIGNDPAGEPAAFGLACAATLLISPLAWAHHYVIALPAVLFVPWWLWTRGRRAAVRALCAVPPVLAAVHYAAIDTELIVRPIGSSLVWTIGLMGVGTTLWYVAACGLILSTSPGAALRIDGPCRD